MVVWTVLMMMWFFGGCYISYENNVFNGRSFIGYSLIPFLCVLLLGLMYFGAISTGVQQQQQQPPPVVR